MTIVEALAVILILGLAICLLLPTRAAWSHGSKYSVCTQRLKDIGRFSASYAAEYRDRLASFSWRAGQPARGAIYPDANPLGASDDASAAAMQATTIIRKRSGLGSSVMGVPINWVPHVSYGHLVLWDYAGLRVPSREHICSEDAERAKWQRIGYFRTGNAQPQPDPSQPGNIRWAFSSSFRFTTSHYSRNVKAPPSLTTVGPSSSPTSFVIGTQPLGDRNLRQVRYPSDKAMLYHDYSRHTSTKYFTGDDRASNLLVAYDMAVSNQSTSLTNAGFDPNGGSPGVGGTFPLTFSNYIALPWEPNASNGRTVYGTVQFTRGGLAGRDFPGAISRPLPIAGSTEVRPPY